MNMESIVPEGRMNEITILQGTILNAYLVSRLKNRILKKKTSVKLTDPRGHVTLDVQKRPKLTRIF